MNTIPYLVTRAMLIMSEVRAAARWCKVRNYRGWYGDPLPELISNRAATWISNNPRAFRQMVSEV